MPWIFTEYKNNPDNYKGTSRICQPLKPHVTNTIGQTSSTPDNYGTDIFYGALELSLGEKCQRNKEIFHFKEVSCLVLFSDKLIFYEYLFLGLT